MEMDRRVAKKQILVSIIISYWPSFEQMGHEYIKPYGKFSSFQNKWLWDRDKLSELKTYQLYDIIHLVAPEKVYLVSLRIKDL